MPGLDAELLCAAHANNVRVLIWDGDLVGCNGGHPSNTSFPCAVYHQNPMNWLVWPWAVYRAIECAPPSARAQSLSYDCIHL